MRKSIILSFTILMVINITGFNLKAQITTEVATGFSSAFSIAFKGSDLYVLDNADKKIIKLDLSVSPATKTDFKTGLGNPNGIAILGNDIYYSDVPARKVIKINSTSKLATDVVTGFENPNALIFKGNELYLSNGLGERISKKDVTTTGTLATEVIALTSSSLFGLAFHGNDLYVTGGTTGKILKIDITASPIVATDAVTGLSGPSGVVFRDDYLYFSDIGTSKVLRINVTATPIVAKTVATGLIAPRGLAIYNDTLYIAESTKISKILLPCPDKPTVTKVGAVLSTATVTGATYQWLDCGNSNAPVLNATNKTYTATATGSYAVAITNSNCKDTSVCTMLTVACTTNKPSVTKSGNTLSITAVTGATYQWLNCNSNNAPIVNASTNTYTATATGSYAIEVTRPDACKDTSVCIAVKGLGIIENTFATDLKLYPNPTSDNITIELGNNYSDVAIDITNILGQVITSKSIATVTNRKIILPINASSGIYFIRIEAKEGFASFRVVKE